MTDIFLRIAERALGLAPIIQPMVAPLYAPTSYDEPLEVAEVTVDSEDSDIDRESYINADGRVTSDMAIGNTTAIASASVSRNTNIADIPPVVKQSHLPLLERNVLASSQTEQETRHTHASQPEMAVLSQEAVIAETTAARPVMAQRETGTQPVGARRENERRVFPPITREERIPAEQSASSAPPERIPAHSTLSHPTPDAMRDTLLNGQPQMENGQRLQHRPLQHERQEYKAGTRGTQHNNETGWEIEQSAPAVPTVHITIGRIEVRANSAPNTQTPAQRQSTAPKTMSLAEYLQQNGKGGRS